MKKRLLFTVAASVMLMGLAAPANAHILEVHHPHSGESISTHNGKPFEWLKAFGDFGWVGGGGAAHGTGLIDACEATADNNVVSLWGPMNPATCPHG